MKKTMVGMVNYLGALARMYDEKGQLAWEARLDMYGKVANFLIACPRLIV
jgi:hypothetical protein